VDSRHQQALVAIGEPQQAGAERSTALDQPGLPGGIVETEAEAGGFAGADDMRLDGIAPAGRQAGIGVKEKQPVA
jgi:hypothetical protein